MPVLLNTAEGLSGHGDAGQLQTPEHAQHDQERKQHRDLPHSPSEHNLIKLYKESILMPLQGFPFFLLSQANHSNSESGQNLNAILPMM